MKLLSDKNILRICIAIFVLALVIYICVKSRGFRFSNSNMIIEGFEDDSGNDNNDDDNNDDDNNDDDNNDDDNNNLTGSLNGSTSGGNKRNSHNNNSGGKSKNTMKDVMDWITSEQKSAYNSINDVYTNSKNKKIDSLGSALVDSCRNMNLAELNALQLWANYQSRQNN